MGLKYAYAALAVIAMGGCAHSTLSRQQCASADWRMLGYEDGARGRASTYFGKHIESCGEGISASQTAYMQGRTEGLGQYCTAENGFAIGKSGAKYRGVCPAATATAFLNEYNRGREGRAKRAHRHRHYHGHYHPAFRAYHRHRRFGFGFSYFGYPFYFGHHFH